MVRGPHPSRGHESVGAANEYHFLTRWRVEGTVDEVFDILGDAQGLVRWWPSVYLDVQELEPGEESGLGKVVSLYTKGWLPYTLRWQFRSTAVDRPRGFALESWGDFLGRGIWTFEQDGPAVVATYDWRVRADKPLLRRLSFLLKPMFAANHHWAMAKGEESLRLELARRHARSPDILERIPAPPGPTPTEAELLRAAIPLVAGVALAYVLFGRPFRR
jgi:hypothetical protein